MKLPFSVQDRDGIRCLTLSEKAGIEITASLRDALLATDLSRDVALNWAQAEHVHTSVIQVLLAWKQLLAEHGRSLTVACDNPQVRSFLQLSGLSEQFPSSSPDREMTEAGSADA